MAQKQSNRKQKKFFGFVLKFLGLFFLFIIFTFSFLFVYYAKDLPRPEKFLEKPFILPTKIYDRTGEILLYKIYGDEKRTIISIKDVPEHLKQAIIATEDGNFYKHFGLDFQGIFRAILINLKLGEIAHGGSTISQQLIRTSFLTMERTLERKIREVILTLELERRYSKEQIFEWYLNQVPFGIAFGVEEASQRFFNKPVSEISLSEAAILAALIKAPSRLSPYGPNKAQLLARKHHVLNRMVAENFLTQEQAGLAKKEDLIFAKPRQEIKAPHFVLHVKQYLINKYGEEFLKERGLKVYTSLDWTLQQSAEKAVEQRIKTNKAHDAHNAALLALDPKTGQILAMVGSAGWFKEPYPENCRSGIDCLFDPQFNAAVGTAQSPGRQPGSAFKPFVYAAAFEREGTDYNDETIVIDEKTNFGIWGKEEYIPRNYDGRFRGPMSLRQSLAQSINVTSVKVLLNLAGLEYSVEIAERLGITTLKSPFGPSLVLGGQEVNLLDMVSAYGVFATQGLRIPPVAILKVEDSRGNILEENKKTLKRVLSSQTSLLINDILSDNEARAPIFGKRSVLYFENYDVAVKTGTTQDFRDAWAIGYTDSLVAGVWAGNNDNSPTKRPGLILAAPIWRAFMEKAMD